MLCHSSPAYHLQFPYAHRPSYLNYSRYYYYYYYYPYNNNFAVSPILHDDSYSYPAPQLQSLYHFPSVFHDPFVRIPRHRFYYDAPPHPHSAPYPLRVLDHRETISHDFRDARPAPVLAHRKERINGFRNASIGFRNGKKRKRRSKGFQDAHTTNSKRKRSHGFNVRLPLQVSNLPNTRCKTRRCKGLQDAQTTPPCQKRSRKFPTRIPKRRTTCNPSQFRASAPMKLRKRKRLPPWIAPKEYSCNSLQVSTRWTTRNSSRFQASPPRKRKRLPPCGIPPRQSKTLPSWISPTDYSPNSLQASAFQKRSHKFRKWFPLRVSNQWRKKRSHRSYACFRCKKQGHFAIRCPQNMINNKTRLSSSVVIVGQDGLQYSPPSLLCWCGLRCSLITVETRKKTSRKVYTCSLKRCKIFRWEDEVKKDELISVPKCQCGAGFCRQCTESGGTEVGRKYFACPIKKGQGACAFFKLLNDESLANNGHLDERISPLRFTKGNCSDAFPANNVQKAIGPYVWDTVEYYPNQRGISGNQKGELMEVELECEEDALNKTPIKCNKRLRDGAPKYDSSFSNAVVEIINVPQSYSEGIVHVRKKRFMRQISIEENALAVSTTSHTCSYTSDLLPLREDWLMTAAVNLNIELFKGWWGRLAYPPSPCLKLPEPKPFYCCVFPSIDPIFVPQIVDEVDWQSQDHPNPQEIPEGSLMFGAISDRFARVARDLQNKLISLLKSSDFRAHDYMDREAKITFTALDQLQVQSQPFCERVNKLIRSASILDKAQGFIIPSDKSYNDSQDYYNSKKRTRDDLISDYDVAKAEVETCKERIHSLSEEASRLMTMLFQVEARVSSCEAENKYHESHFAQISIDLIESGKRLQVAEEDLRFLQQKKEEYDAAEAAYKKAKIELGIIT